MFDMFQGQEREYIETARIGRLATADSEGRPHVVPICFALADDHIVTPIDEKPQRVAPESLRRSRDISENPRAAVIIDHYSDDWSQLGWVQVRGTAAHCPPSDASHSAGVTALEQKYEQYAGHDLEARPLIRIDPGSVRSWGQLKRPEHSRRSP
jgi:PPOX class probable F420-dependent enzyme